MPREPVRTSSTSRPRWPPQRPAPRHVVGAQRQRGGVARDDRRAGSSGAPPSSGVEPRRRRAAPSGRRRAAPPGRSAHRPRQIDRFQRHRAVGRGVVPVDAEPWRAWAASASAPSAWQASARQSCSTWRPGRLAAEIVVEADHAMHFGAADRFSASAISGTASAWHVAERVLQRVQDRQGGAFAGGLRGDDFRCVLPGPRLEPGQ